MNTSVHNELLQSDSCNLSADGIEAGKNDGFRCIVDNEIHTGHGLKGTDISSLATDDTTFHLIIGKLYHRDCRLGYMISRTFLNGIDHIFLCFLACVFLCSGFQLFIELRRVMLDFVFNSF